MVGSIGSIRKGLPTKLIKYICQGQDNNILQGNTLVHWGKTYRATTVFFKATRLAHYYIIYDDAIIGEYTDEFKI